MLNLDSVASVNSISQSQPEYSAWVCLTWTDLSQMSGDQRGVRYNVVGVITHAGLRLV